VPELLTQIRAVVTEALELERCPSDDADLTDLGMSSIEAVALVAALEERLGFEFGDEQLVLANFLTIERIDEQVACALSSVGASDGSGGTDARDHGRVRAAVDAGGAPQPRRANGVRIRGRQRGVPRS
jgi:acyl carrier protein